MKTKLFALFVMALATTSLLLSGCIIARKHVSIEVSCDDFYANQNISDEIEVSSGGTITITLCSNPSTGLQWEPTVCCPYLSIFLVEVDHKFIPPEETGNMPPAPGTPGKEIWVYKAYNEGSATISLDYRRPGETSERGEWTYNLTVFIE